MNIAVRYITRSGNTQKVAEAIAKEAGVKAENCSVGLASAVDLLFLGGSIYANGVDQSLRTFINQLEPSKVKYVAVFGTAALKKEPDREIEKLVQNRGITVLNLSFHCRGSFAFVHRGHPNDSDLKNAAVFAQTVLNEIKGGK